MWGHARLRPVDAWLLLTLGMVMLGCRWLASQTLPLYDDAFITLRYARNLATGAGLVYQPGEAVLGTTAPGFAALNSLLFALRLPMPQATQALNALLDVLIVYLTVWAMPPASRWLGGVLLTVLLAANPILARISVGGMEMMAYLAVSLLACLCFLRDAKRAAYLLAALAYVLRPEALILWAVLLGIDLVKTIRRRSSQAARDLALATLLAALVFGLILLGTYLVYGQVIPQSVVAKSQLTKPPVLDVLRLFLAPDGVTLLVWPMALLGFVGSIIDWSARSLRKTGDTSTRLALILGLWSFGYISLYALFRPQIWSWYGAPVYYSGVVLAALAGVAVVQRIAWLKRLVHTRWVLVGLLCLPLLVWGVVWRVVGPSGVTRHIYTPLAQWCAESIQPGQSIMAYDIGAIGYYCDVRIYDLAGLVWPAGANLSSVDAAIETYQPDFLFITAVRGNITWLNQPALSATYRPLARFSRSGERDLTLMPARFPIEWTQDYILLQRIR